jgi:hypothetical protein
LVPQLCPWPLLSPAVSGLPVPDSSDEPLPVASPLEDVETPEPLLPPLLDAVGLAWPDAAEESEVAVTLGDAPADADDLLPPPQANPRPCRAPDVRSPFETSPEAAGEGDTGHSNAKGEGINEGDG